MILRLTVVAVVLLELTAHLPSTGASRVQQYPQQYPSQNPQPRGQKKKILRTIETTISKLTAGLTNALGTFGFLNISSGEEKQSLDKISKAQAKSVNKQHDLNKLTQAVKKDTKAVLDKDSEIQDGQGSIKDVILTSHQETRAQVQSSQESIQEDIGKVLDGQKDIRGRLDISQEAILSDLDVVKTNQGNNRNEIQAIQRSLAENAKADARGQEKIEGAVVSSRKTIQNVISKLSNGQKDTQNSLVTNQEAIDRNFNRVTNALGVLDENVKTSQKIIQSEIHRVKKGEDSIQSKVEASQQALQTDIKEVTSGQAVTQHLLKTCSGPQSSCDLSKVEKVLSGIEKYLENGDSTFQENVAKIFAAETELQTGITQAQADIVKELENNHAETRIQIKRNAQALAILRSKIKSDFGALQKEFEDLLSDLTTEIAELETTINTIWDIVITLKNTPRH